ncbi:MAG: UDP-3-O-(3-hydroxymyristoyl)glucosamine N-acyltransferase [Bryobacterales bacterium]|nr:UDP-3-O-(3-hydroxymyristoyl)glucosamine N-acyltransferase [Bryobacterales bacterium]MBV9400473.1 UDP-3-O-(3-hydroxymyristoyl)glucosamine N-acyltransferase [Bryobacterales bacterium]
MKVRELAGRLSAEWEGDGEHEIRRVAALEDAGPDELAFVSRGRAEKQAEASAAGCLLVSGNYSNLFARTVIRARDPRGAAAKAISLLHPDTNARAGVHPTAVIGADVHVGDGCSVGPGCTIGDRVTIGDGCVLHPRVTIYHDVRIGDRVILHSGCVIGADGFGFVFTDGRYEKFPQVGRVEIGDNVEIGANSCIDRAALGVTSIGEGTKLDNLVHVGHNCRIGKHVVVAAQTGFSGGVVVEDYAVIGGQVGVGDKARIESRAVVGSGSGILTSKIVHGGQVVWGTPARPLKEYLQQLAVLSRLAKKK